MMIEDKTESPLSLMLNSFHLFLEADLHVNTNNIPFFKYLLFTHSCYVSRDSHSKNQKRQTEFMYK